MKESLLFIILVITGCSESKETRLQKFLLKGNLKVKEQNLGQAANYFKEALKLDPCFADAANNLGTVYFKQEHWSQAMEQYEIAIRCRPDFLNAYFNRANTSYELKEYYRALEDPIK
jgi:tetratricopeptide (TPR) repeat protein